ncbi:hypothetical protein M0R19_05430 [Candidatus Pacearchaeota archaeon]|jgi:hypothetical protein|nr:hypothetical protein [Candidatus Pacearchaeota archaeon]
MSDLDQITKYQKALREIKEMLPTNAMVDVLKDEAREKSRPTIWFMSTTLENIKRVIDETI